MTQNNCIVRALSVLGGLFGFTATAVAPVKTVLLYRSNGDVKQTKVTPTQAGGWIARWHDLPDSELHLLPGGTLENKSSVVKWRPHSGWSDDEILLAMPPAAPIALPPFWVPELKAAPEQAQSEADSKQQTTPPAFGLD